MQGLAVRLNLKRSQGRPWAGYRAAKRVDVVGIRLCRLAEFVEAFNLSAVTNGQTGNDHALRGGDGSRYRRCRFRVLEKSILGTADSEYRHSLGVRRLLL